MGFKRRTPPEGRQEAAHMHKTLVLRILPRENSSEDAWQSMILPDLSHHLPTSGMCFIKWQAHHKMAFYLKLLPCTGLSWYFGPTWSSLLLLNVSAELEKVSTRHYNIRQPILWRAHQSRKATYIRSASSPDAEKSLVCLYKVTKDIRCVCLVVFNKAIWGFSIRSK